MASNSIYITMQSITAEKTKKTSLISSKQMWSAMDENLPSSDDSVSQPPVFTQFGDYREESIKKWLESSFRTDSTEETLQCSSQTVADIRRLLSGEDDLMLGEEASLFERGLRNMTVKDYIQSVDQCSRTPVLSRWNSISSNQSGVSTTKSITELLKLWEEDPEEILMDLGFGIEDPDISAKIPSRFLSNPSIAKGINILTLFEAQKERMNSENHGVHSRFRQLQVLEEVTSAFSNLFNEVSTAQENYSENKTKTSVTEEKQPKSQKYRHLLREASRMAVTQDSKTAILKKDKEEKFSEIGAEKRTAFRKTRPGHSDSTTLAPVMEEHLSGKENMPLPHKPLGKSAAVSQSTNKVYRKSPSKEISSKHQALREPNQLFGHAILKPGYNHQPPDSFEMEEIQSFDEECCLGNAADNTSDVFMKRTNSCQSDSSGFMEEISVPLPLQDQHAVDNICSDSIESIATLQGSRKFSEDPEQKYRVFIPPSFPSETSVSIVQEDWEISLAPCQRELECTQAEVSIAPSDDSPQECKTDADPCMKIQSETCTVLFAGNEERNERTLEFEINKITTDLVVSSNGLESHPSEISNLIILSSINEGLVKEQVEVQQSAHSSEELWETTLKQDTLDNLSNISSQTEECNYLLKAVKSKKLPATDNDSHSEIILQHPFALSSTSDEGLDSKSLSSSQYEFPSNAGVDKQEVSDILSYDTLLTPEDDETRTFLNESVESADNTPCSSKPASEYISVHLPHQLQYSFPKKIFLRKHSLDSFTDVHELTVHRSKEVSVQTDTVKMVSKNISTDLLLVNTQTAKPESQKGGLHNNACLLQEDSDNLSGHYACHLYRHQCYNFHHLSSSHTAYQGAASSTAANKCNLNTEAELCRTLKLLQQTIKNTVASPYTFCDIYKMKRSLQGFRRQLVDIEQQLIEEQALVFSNLSDAERENVKHLKVLRRAVLTELSDLEDQLEDQARHAGEGMQKQIEQLLEEQLNFCFQVEITVDEDDEMDWSNQMNSQYPYVQSACTHHCPPVSPESTPIAYNDAAHFFLATASTVLQVPSSGFLKTADDTTLACSSFLPDELPDGNRDRSAETTEVPGLSPINLQDAAHQQPIAHDGSMAWTPSTTENFTTADVTVQQAIVLSQLSEPISESSLVCSNSIVSVQTSTESDMLYQDTFLEDSCASELQSSTYESLLASMSCMEEALTERDGPSFVCSALPLTVSSLQMEELKHMSTVAESSKPALVSAPPVSQSHRAENKYLPEGEHFAEASEDDKVCSFATDDMVSSLAMLSNLQEVVTPEPALLSNNVPVPKPKRPSVDQKSTKNLGIQTVDFLAFLEQIKNSFRSTKWSGKVKESEKE